ncbi:MAG: sugar transferase [Acidobacteria bacterium]|nr:sugar transferase [Acidobacteriota bacterium]
MSQSWYVRRGKRLFDVVISLLLLVLGAPLMCGVALLVWATLGRPVLFSQLRPGFKGRPFRMMKFRTMADVRDATGQLLPDRDRLGRVGRVLRSLSLDELPELINVLRGEMSLVGPRPLLMAYLPRYTREQSRRHAVMPGLTGWAQVNGRNALTWPDKFRLDVWYVDHLSLRLDARILLRTVGQVLRRDGISQAGHVTAEEFMGNNQAEGPP